MKTPEEIDELYHKCWDDFIRKHDNNLHYYSFVEGYNQCQEDMAKDLQSILNNSVYVDFISKKEILKYINSLNKQD